MSRNIYLFWFKYDKGHGNFGDELNHYIISRLSPSEINYIDPHSFSDSPFIAFKAIISKILFHKVSFKQISTFPEWNTIFGRKIIFGIGSIIGYYTTTNIIVWGSGIISKNDIVSDADFRAVRGKYTQNRILELGYRSDAVFGDPAMLLPLVYKPKVKIKYSLGIIPHYIHYDSLINKYENNNIKIINLLDPIEQVIDNICSCEFTISTSLHGIIVSHCYGIKSLWVNFSELSSMILTGDNIKFYDYYSSVDLPIKDVLQIKNGTDLFGHKNNFIEKLFALSIIPKASKINEIQMNLLNVAPFTLKKEFSQKTTF